MIVQVYHLVVEAKREQELVDCRPISASSGTEGRDATIQRRIRKKKKRQQKA